MALDGFLLFCRFILKIEIQKPYDGEGTSGLRSFLYDYESSSV